MKKFLILVSAGLLGCLVYYLLFKNRYADNLMLWIDTFCVVGLVFLLVGFSILCLNWGIFSSTAFSFRRTAQVIKKNKVTEHKVDNSIMETKESKNKTVPDSYAEYLQQRKKDRPFWEWLLSGSIYFAIGLLIYALC